MSSEQKPSERSAPVTQGVDFPQEGAVRPAVTEDTGAARTDEISTKVSATSTEAHEKFSQDLHAFVREIIQRGDQKAGFFFAASTALLALLYNKQLSARWLRPVCEWSMLDAVTLIAMAALGVTSILSLAVVLPRNRGRPEGHIFWRAIAQYDSGDAFAKSVFALDRDALTREKLANVHAIARSCTRKYDILALAMWTGAIGLVASVLVLLFARA